ncbi:Orf y [Tanacetum coccineum]
MSRLNYPKCQLTTCSLCARNYLGKTVKVKGKQPHKPEEEKDFSNNEIRLLKELLKEKTEQVQQMIKDQSKEYYENRATMQRKEELWQSEKSLLVKDLTDALKIIDQLKIEQMRLEEQKDEEIRKPFMEAEVHYSGNTTTPSKIRKITNQFYNVKVEFEIPSCPMFRTTAIIDTGASTCCINKKVIPEDALEPLTQTIPLIYSFDMNDSNGIEMLIGANFLRSMKGGIQIEGDEITIYKKVTRIKTSNQTEVVEVAITELERLKYQGYIKEDPLKHWKKNGELCINAIIKRVGDAKIFSKFDLKSGFHQVAMDEESIPWTVFLVP